MHTAEYRAFAAALCDAATPPPTGLMAPPRAVVAERFNVYRNNVHLSLIDALRDRYPVSGQLVGEQFFYAMAKAFVQQIKPDNPVLLTYGHAFPAFIAGFTPAAHLVYLPEIAQLENLWSEAWAAADAPALQLGDLAGIAPTELLASRIKVHPAARLLSSPAPVASLWQAHQQSAPDLSGIVWQSEEVLVTRPLAQVHLRKLAPGIAAFASALAAGATIEAAAGTQCATDFDIGQALGGLISDGFVMEI